MVDKPNKNTGGKGHVLETLNGMGDTAKHTGGGLVQRRFLNDYCKTRHEEHDKQAAEMMNVTEPDISGPFNVI